MLTRLTDRLRRFARDTAGSYSVEAVMILPLLIWGGISTLTYVDGYRAQTMNLRTTYAIADMLSRQFDPIGQDFIDGLGRTHRFLTNGAHDTSLRVTVVYWDEEEEEHVLVWSEGTGGAPDDITDATLSTVTRYIPALADADTAILVETWMSHIPAFNIGLGNSNFVNRVVTSPRGPQLKWDTDA